jgi:hypothetical protein
VAFIFLFGFLAVVISTIITEAYDSLLHVQALIHLKSFVQISFGVKTESELV